MVNFLDRINVKKLVKNKTKTFTLYNWTHIATGEPTGTSYILTGSHVEDGVTGGLVNAQCRSAEPEQTTKTLDSTVVCVDAIPTNMQMHA